MVLWSKFVICFALFLTDSYLQGNDIVAVENGAFPDDITEM